MPGIRQMSVSKAKRIVMWIACIEYFPWLVCGCIALFEAVIIVLPTTFDSIQAISPVYGIKFLLELVPLILVFRGNPWGIKCLIWIHRLAGIGWIVVYTSTYWIVILISLYSVYSLIYSFVFLGMVLGCGVFLLTLLPCYFYRKALRLLEVSGENLSDDPSKTMMTE